MTRKNEILIALTAGDSPTLGNVWRITAKKHDFYIDSWGENNLAHLSFHGPGEKFSGHRFHMQVDRDVAKAAESEGHFVAYEIPRKGYAFDGKQISDRAFLAARIRFPWHLQRPRYRSAALTGVWPDLVDDRFGARLSTLLKPNGTWDIDIVLSYGEPYWPDAERSLRDGSRLGPLHNDSGMWLTATSYHRSEASSPAPSGLIPRRPRVGEHANRLICAGPGSGGTSDFYWFTETITSRELVEASRAALGS